MKWKRRRRQLLEYLHVDVWWIMERGVIITLKCALFNELLCLFWIPIECRSCFQKNGFHKCLMIAGDIWWHITQECIETGVEHPPLHLNLVLKLHPWHAHTYPWTINLPCKREFIFQSLPGQLWQGWFILDRFPLHCFVITFTLGCEYKKVFMSFLNPRSCSKFRLPCSQYPSRNYKFSYRHSHISKHIKNILSTWK